MMCIPHFSFSKIYCLNFVLTLNLTRRPNVVTLATYLKSYSFAWNSYINTKHVEIFYLKFMFIILRTSSESCCPKDISCFQSTFPWTFDIFHNLLLKVIRKPFVYQHLYQRFCEFSAIIIESISPWQENFSIFSACDR